MATSSSAVAPTSNISKMNEATLGQLSAGLVLQGYCTSILQQGNVDFSADPNLQELQTQVNSGLSVAKDHAQTYLNGIAPSILVLLSNLNNYATIYSSVPTTLPPGSTTEQWLQSLMAVRQVSESNLKKSQAILNDLQRLSTDLDKDTATFSQLAYQLNQTVNGDKGQLDDIAEQLKSLDSQIAGTITGVVFAGLTIGAGVFMIIVGSVADFVTAGTNPELIIGGVATIIGGVGTEAGTIATMVSLYQQKSALLTKQSALKAEVNLVAGAASGYTQLCTQVTAAAGAAATMANAWEALTTDLTALINDLQNGILTTDAIRTMFLEEANGDIQELLTDIQSIKEQMAGVTTKVAPKGQSLVSQLATLAQLNSSN